MDTATDTFTPDDVSATPNAPQSNAPMARIAPKQWANHETSNRTLPLDKAHKIVQFYTDNPSWLADPRTSHAAEAVLGSATKVISLNMQLEKAGAQGEASRIRTDFINQKIKDLSAVGPLVPRGDKSGQSELGRLNGLISMIGSLDFNLQDFSTGVAWLQSEYTKPKPEFQSNPGKEVADRLTLEKQFGANSPQVKRFDELTEKSSSLSNLGKLLKEREGASPEDKAIYDYQIGHLGQKMGVSIQFDDQGRPIINYGPQETSIGAPSVATQSMAQRKLLKYEAASELINHLQKNMETGHVGLSGVLGEYVGDRILPQLGVDSFKGKRADVRSTLIAARESLLREISDDTRFSNADREEISRALPSSGVFESLPNAQQRLETVRNILNARGRTYSEGLGLKQPEWSLSPDEIKKLYDKHEATKGKEGISFEKAQSLLERFHHFTP